MSITIIETLEAAEYNLNNGFGVAIAKQQLHIAVALLWKGYSPYDEIEPLLEKYGDVEKVPEKSQ
jgi:hypothetical protein